MRVKRYRDFSAAMNSGYDGRPAAGRSCQFELTFACALHCAHCYSDCYNRPDMVAQQMDTPGVVAVFRKLRAAGVLWLCLTGGDPLARRDFPEIYRKAKEHGFIVTLYTNAYSMTGEIARMLAAFPPLRVEATLNAVDPRMSDQITGVRGSLPRILRGIRLLRDRGVALSLKTQVTGMNYSRLKKISAFVRSLGMPFRPQPLIFARLNHDPFPCTLRIDPAEVAAVQRLPAQWSPDCAPIGRSTKRQPARRPLFSCALTTGHTVYVDPCGKLTLCQCLRKDSFDLLRGDFNRGVSALRARARSRFFDVRAACNRCSFWQECANCPGRAYLETGNEQSAVAYFCALAGKPDAKGGHV